MTINRLAVGSLLVLAAVGLAFANEAVERTNFNEGVIEPYLLPDSRVSPEYPAAAFDARIEGSVVLAALVSEEGEVLAVETLDSSAPGVGFEAAAEGAIRQWRFEPGEKDGERIAAYSVVRLSFRRTGGERGTGYVTANFAPTDMLGASIVANLAPAPTANPGEGMAPMGGDLDPERGGYHPRIPPGLYPGAAYLRNAWWPAREHDLGDMNHAGTNPDFVVGDK